MECLCKIRRVREWEAGGGRGLVRKPQDKWRKKMCYCSCAVSSYQVSLHPGSLCPVLVGSWGNEGLRSTSDGAS